MNNPGNIGDIDLENASRKTAVYTPVPGGVDPMTGIGLIKQTMEAAKKRLGLF